MGIVATEKTKGLCDYALAKAEASVKALPSRDNGGRKTCSGSSEAPEGGRTSSQGSCDARITVIGTECT